MSKQIEKSELVLTGIIDGVETPEKGEFYILKLRQEKEYQGKTTTHKFDVLMYKDNFEAFNVRNGERLMIFATLSAPERTKKDGSHFHPVSIWANNILKSTRKLTQSQPRQTTIQPQHDDIPF